ncbi:MAG: phosphohistidine phosphatase SixA [Deltaproteobacteria bacterium]|nr:phosphohistidine phosphatase SixA [Deltaproteobacteria bacterium]
MRLYLVQTGEALPMEKADFDRPLSDKGRLHVEKLTSLLSRANLQSKKVIHSGNTRAQQTLEILRWAATPERRLVEARSGLNPNDPVEPWVQEIAQWTEDAVIVGHQPFLGKLASRLVAGTEDAQVVLFVPTTAVCVEKDATGWSVAWMITPELSSVLGRY